MARQLMVFVGLLSVGFTGALPAEVLVWEFTGTFNHTWIPVPGITANVGDPITGRLSYDTASVDLEPDDPSKGCYPQSIAQGLTLTVNGVTLSASEYRVVVRGNTFGPIGQGISFLSTGPISSTSSIDHGDVALHFRFQPFDALYWTDALPENLDDDFSSFVAAHAEVVGRGSTQHCELGPSAPGTSVLKYLQFLLTSLTAEGPSNLPPTALCQDIVVDGGSCSEVSVSAAQVDAGSSDPEGGALIRSLTPPGPYGPGDTAVTLTVTDPEGLSASCSATITVECAQFIRGDADGDGLVGMADGRLIIRVVFGIGTSTIECEDAGDVNDDGALTVDDALQLFAGLVDPPPPFPACGNDPISPVDSLTCLSYDACN